MEDGTDLNAIPFARFGNSDVEPRLSKAPPDTDDDDDEEAETAADVVAMLGFDPKEFSTPGAQESDVDSEAPE